MIAKHPVPRRTLRRGRGLLRDWSDRLAASDPGLNRVIQALQVALSVSVTVAVEYGFAETVHPLWAGAPAGASPSVAQAAMLAAQHHGAVVLTLLLGGIVALLSTLAVLDTTPRAQAVTLSLFPLPILASMAISLALVPYHTIGLVVLALVMGVGFYGRRFVPRVGPRAFLYGVVLFIGYFFGFLAGAAIGLGGLGWVAAILWLAGATNLLLRVAVYNPIARGTLRRTRRSFAARARTSLTAAIELLDTHGGAERDRRGRRLRRRLLRLNEAALLIDGQLADPRFGLDDEQVRAAHGELFDLELTVANIGRLVGLLATSDIDAGVRDRVRAWLVELRSGRTDGAIAALRAVRNGQTGGVPAALDRRTANRLHGLLAAIVGAGESLEAWTSARAVGISTMRADADGDITAYESPVVLFAGNLPGSAQVSQAAVSPDEAQRSLRGRLGLSAPAQGAIRMALAVGVACAAGSGLSERRFYWAVIAVFIAYMGANTAGEQVTKAAHRVAGTVVGIFIGSVLAHAIGPSPWSLAVIVPALSIGVYFLRISYSLMVIGITIMVSQLYVQLGEYSFGLLELRLEETALGAGIAMLAALLVFPVATGRAARQAVSGYLRALCDLVARLPDALCSGGGGRELSAQARALDNALQQLVATARPLTRDPFRREEVAHNMGLWTTSAEIARNLAAQVGRAGPLRDTTVDEWRAALDTEQETLRAILAVVDGERDARRVYSAYDRLAGLDRDLVQRGVATRDRRRRILRNLGRLDQTLAEVADNVGLSPQPPPGPSPRATRERPQPVPVGGDGPGPEPRPAGEESGSPMLGAAGDRAREHG